MSQLPDQSFSAALASAKPPCSRHDAQAVLDTLRAAGHVAYFAGGCVRDSPLEREPKDWDVASDARPDRVRALFPNTQAVGAAFGVILVRHHRSVVEVATFRSDAEYVDGRHPTGVRFGKAREDAERRDFTINGLFLDPSLPGDLEWQVIDYVGGRADLKDRLIRAIGDPQARFNDDHLRMLRAVRFAARLGFDIEPATAAAIRQHAGQLVRISPERIAEELRMILTPPSRPVGYAALDDLGLRPMIFRFLELPTGQGRLDRSVSILRQLSPGQPIPFGLALAGAAMDHYLWHGPANADARRLFERPVAQKIVRALRQSLKISNDESEDSLGTLQGLDSLLGDAVPTVARLKRFLARPTSPLSRELLRATDSVGVLDKPRVQWLTERLAELSQTGFAPAPLITGDDLTGEGLAPGPTFKRVLDAVYDAQLEDRVADRAEAMALALQLAGVSP